MSRDVLPMKVAAGYVLHETGDPNQIGPGGFYAKLIAAAMHADGLNLMRIGNSFRTIAIAVYTYKNIGVEELRLLAAGDDLDRTLGALPPSLPLSVVAPLLIEWITAERAGRVDAEYCVHGRHYDDVCHACDEHGDPTRRDMDDGS